MLSAFVCVLAMTQSRTPGVLLPTTELTVGPWHAWLESPLGRLPFDLELQSTEDGIESTIRNGSERIDVPESRVEPLGFWCDLNTCMQSAGELPRGDALILEFPQYDARIVASLDATGDALHGEWFQRTGASDWRHLRVEAEAGSAPRFDVHDMHGRAPDRVFGRWNVKFAKEHDPAVAILRAGAGANAVEGIILTAKGADCSLAGVFVNDALLLSGFDGAQALLVTGMLQDDGSLKGQVSGSDTQADTWIADRDEHAQIPDALSRAHWSDAFGLALLQYPDLDGNLVSLGDARFAGKVRILQVAGSWSPGSQDETALLADLDHAYRDKGLSITALCFETTGRLDHDAQQARELVSRHDAHYPALLAGQSDKVLAQQALPALDTVFAFPTTVFLHRDGRVRAVYSGFTGPAAAEDHARLRAQFVAIVEELLAEPLPKDSIRAHEIADEMWRDERERTFTSFERAADGTLHWTTMEMTRFDRPTRTDPISTGAAVIDGTVVRLGPLTLQYDARAKVMLDASDVAHRFTPAVRSPFPFVDAAGYSEMPLILAGLSSSDAVRRRESAFYLALQIVQDRHTPAEMGGGRLDPGLSVNLMTLVTDPDPLVRATACWAVGVTGVDKAGGALETNLEHGFAPVRREAARALGALHHVASQARLEKLAAEDIDPLVRARAAESAALLARK